MAITFARTSGASMHVRDLDHTFGIGEKIVWRPRSRDAQTVQDRRFSSEAAQVLDQEAHRRVHHGLSAHWVSNL
jgi:hypothetical protein